MVKQERLWAPKPHRAVNWNGKAVQKCIDKHGYVLVSPKLDGVRAVVKLTPDGLLITSREGIRIRSLDERLVGLQQELRRQHVNMIGKALDCELYIAGIDFDTASGHIRRHAALPLELDVRIGVFDYTDVSADAGMVAEDCLQHRVDYIKDQLEDFPGCFHYVPHIKAQSLAAVQILYDEYRAKGLEGLVVKDPELPYRNGKVSGWWKLKPEITEDGVVVGYVWGTEDKANAGLIVGFEVELESGHKVKATGLTREQMQEVTDLAETDYLTGMDRPLMGRYCEVRAMERTKAGSLRHPSFVCWRDLESAPGVKL